MSHRPKPLKLDKRKGRWSAKDPASPLEEWAAKDDDYHVGFLFGLCLGGSITTIFYTLGHIVAGI